MSWMNNDHLNRKLFAAIMDAQIAHEAGGNDRRLLLKRARNKAVGHLRKTIDRVLALDDDKMNRFFERVCREYGV